MDMPVIQPGDRVVVAVPSDDWKGDEWNAEVLKAFQEWMPDVGWRIISSPKLTTANVVLVYRK